MILFALLLAIPPANAIDLRLENFVRSEDGDDWSPAVRRYQEDPRCRTLSMPTSGCTLEFPNGKLRMSTSINLCPAMTVVGQGGAVGAPATLLSFPPGVTGFKVGTCLVDVGKDGIPDLRPASGMRSTIEKLAIEEMSSSTVSVGIEATVRFAVRDVWIHGFGTGMDLESRIETGVNTNVNNTSITDVTFTRPRLFGFVASGPALTSGVNASQMTLTNVEIKEACYGAVQPQICSAAFFHGFVASDIRGMTIHTTQNLRLRQLFPGVIARGNNAKNIFTNLYVEFNSAPNEIGAPNILIGGVWQLAVNMDPVVYDAMPPWRTVFPSKGRVRLAVGSVRPEISASKDLWRRGDVFRLNRPPLTSEECYESVVDRVLADGRLFWWCARKGIQ